jgi:hypothetical protein
MTAIKSFILILFAGFFLSAFSQTALKQPVYLYWSGDTIYCSVNGRTEVFKVIKGLSTYTDSLRYVSLTRHSNDTTLLRNEIFARYLISDSNDATKGWYRRGFIDALNLLNYKKSDTNSATLGFYARAYIDAFMSLVFKYGDTTGFRNQLLKNNDSTIVHNFLIALLDTANITRIGRANHLVLKQTIDSIFLSNIASGKILYQNDFKLVNSPVSTDGKNVRIGYNAIITTSSQTAVSTTDPIGGTTNIMIGQSFTGNGSLLSGCAFGMENYNNLCTANYLRAYLYAHTGSFGTSSIPTGSPLAVSIDSLAPLTLPSSDYTPSGLFHFDSTYTLTNGTKFVMVVRYIGCGGGNNVNVGMKTSATEGEGNASYSEDGVNWTYNSRRVKYEIFGIPPTFSIFHLIGGNTLILGTVNGFTLKQGSNLSDTLKIISDTSAFSTTDLRKAIPIAGGLTTYKYIATPRVLTGDETTVPTEVLYCQAKLDSLIVFRNAAIVSGLKFSYLRIK